MIKPVTVHDRVDNDPRRGFRTFTEFLNSVKANRHARDRDQVRDVRLVPLAARPSAGGDLSFIMPPAYTPPSLRAAAGSDEQGTYADTYGGFAVKSPTVAPFALGRSMEDPTVGRTLEVPMDAPIMTLPAWSGDGDRAQTVTAGLQLTRTPETVDPGASRGKFEAITLEASTLLGITFATEDLLGNNPRAFIAILARGYRDELDATLLREKIRGLGGNEYLGVLNSGARISVDKEVGQAADTINSLNVIKMRKRCWGYRRAIWLATHDAYEQLAPLSIAIGTGGSTALYHHAQVEGAPDMLSGRPIFFTEHASVLGDEGDVILCDWSQYIEATYTPLKDESSMHVRFLEHERAFRFWTRNAGAPWWREPVTPAESITTLSPIVTLAERA